MPVDTCGRGARVHRWEEKAGFSFLFEYESVPTPHAPAGLGYEVDKLNRKHLESYLQGCVLVLPEVERMTPPVLRKIRELVRGGATVLGPKPLKSPSLAGYPEADSELAEMAAELWGDLDGVSRTRRAYGEGTVVWGLTPAEVLASLRVPPDVEYSRGLDADLAWIHRREGDADIYFIANRADRALDADVRFRVVGKEAELRCFPRTPPAASARRTR